MCNPLPSAANPGDSRFRADPGRGSVAARGGTGMVRAAAGEDGPTAWRRLGVALAAALVGNVGMWAYVVLIPAVQAEFGTARGAAAVPYTAAMLGFAAGNVAMGRLADRLGLARTMLLAAVLQVAGIAASALAPGLIWLALAQGAVNLGAATFFGPLIADVSFWFRRRRGIAVALAACGNYLAGAIWPLVLSAVLAAQGWRVVAALLAVLVLAAVPPLALALRAPPPAPTAVSIAAEAARAAGPGLPPRTLLALLALSGLGCCVAMAMPQVHIVPYCVDLGYGLAVGAEMRALILAGDVVSRIVSGLVADRLGGVRTLLIGATLQALALTLYLPAGSMVSLYAVSLVFGLAQGGIVPSYALIVRERLPARDAGTQVGIVMMTTILGMALGGWMAGAIYDATGGYGAAFVNGIVWNLIPVAVMLILLRGAPPAPARA